MQIYIINVKLIKYYLCFFVCVCSEELSDQNDDDDDDDDNDDTELDDSNGGKLLQRRSLKRLNRLNLVASKLQEVREQRDTLLAKLQEDMDQEDIDAITIGKDDVDVLRELRGNADGKNDQESFKNTLEDRYGRLVRTYTH